MDLWNKASCRMGRDCARPFECPSIDYSNSQAQRANVYENYLSTCLPDLLWLVLHNCYSS